MDGCCSICNSCSSSGTYYGRRSSTKLVIVVVSVRSSISSSSSCTYSGRKSSTRLEIVLYPFVLVVEVMDGSCSICNSCSSSGIRSY